MESLLPSKNMQHDLEICLQIIKDRAAEVVKTLDHPKKSLTAYTLFVKIKRQQILERNPNAKTPEIMKEIG